MFAEQSVSLHCRFITAWNYNQSEGSFKVRYSAKGVKERKLAAGLVSLLEDEDHALIFLQRDQT